MEAGSVLIFPCSAPKTTAWQANRMKDFVYVYILVSQTTKRFTTLALHTILNNDSSNIIEAIVRIRHNIGHGELKPLSRSNPKAKRASSRNIKKADLVASSLAVTFDI
jgi:hypothetical protein